MAGTVQPGAQSISLFGVEQVNMDAFIELFIYKHLPLAAGFGCIILIYDHFKKRAQFTRHVRDPFGESRQLAPPRQ